MTMRDDPFSPESDPDFVFYPNRKDNIAIVPNDCQCGATASSFTRRQMLLGISALSIIPAMVPVNSVASSFIPCVQDTQRVKPCRHKFCRHYSGEGDYYGR